MERRIDTAARLNDNRRMYFSLPEWRWPTDQNRSRRSRLAFIAVLVPLPLPLLLVPVFLILAGGLAACADSKMDTPGSGDGGPDAAEVDTTDGTIDISASDGVDVGNAGVRCSAADLAANDKSSIPGQIQIFATTQPVPLPPDWHPPQYRQPCITIKAGQNIDFRGDFTLYPLEPAGGDIPNPIPTVANLPVVNGVIPQFRVNFPNPGVFGYQCATYPLDMFGAVRVDP